jgi:hypothetical protein
MPDSPAEIRLLESEQIRRFAETATAFRHLSVPQMPKLNRHVTLRFPTASCLQSEAATAIDKLSRQWH